MNLKAVARVIAGVVMALGVALLAPLAISLVYDDGSWESFLFPASLMIFVGISGFRALPLDWATERFQSV